MRAARQDSNHKEIADYFRKFGCSVRNTHDIGSGFPDIVVGKNFKTVLVEIKDGKKPASAQALTPDEVKFHGDWQGGVFVVKDLSDVIALVKALEKGTV